ncbi:MAG: hypothetical protein ACKVS8_11660 [Phycisphaerales bacterium]
MCEKSWEQTLHLSKLDAAERQFKLAVQLFFQRADPVGTYALACASVQILSDLLSAAGAGGLSRNPHLIPEGRFNEWRNAIKRPENFLKHAERDPGAMLEFNTGVIPVTLLECALLLEIVAQRVMVETRMFTIWMMHAYPEMFRLEPEQHAALQHLDKNNFEEWLAALDDRTGEIGKLMESWKPRPMPKTPYDIRLGTP